MAGVVEVRGVKIGEEIPKIIVPIVGVTKEEIVGAARALAGARKDLVEWRADWFENVMDFEEVELVLGELRAVISEVPLLFTFRTGSEGGEKEISREAYAALNIRAAHSGLVDLIDVEAFIGDETVHEITAAAHAAGVKIVASNHDFDRTPVKEEILKRLCRMQELGADICKIAVMPRCKRDVLVLLSATQEMVADYADRPVITMSMGGTGLISRLCGEVFGSACTFGAVGKASAPGQIGASDLGTVLDLIHGSL